MDIVLISGMSGSGKSVALRALEDRHFYCVDNLPPALLPSLVESLPEVKRLAVAIDVRSLSPLQVLPQVVAGLRAASHQLRLLFLDASDHALVRRFSETRRRHPLTNSPDDSGHSLLDSIQRERDMLASLDLLVTFKIDTTDLKVVELRQQIDRWLESPGLQFALSFLSFGFKGGLPLQADFVFDVRHLPNPYYEPSLKPLTGLDQAVVDFLERYSQTREVVLDIATYLRKRLEDFSRDGRNYLTVAVGCTGGQHRSVYVVEALCREFLNYPLLMPPRHRDAPLPVYPISTH